MPDTRASGAHAAPNAHDLPVQTDNVSFRGIIWFLVVIFVTTFACEGIITGLFKYLEYDVNKTDVAAAPLAGPRTFPEIQGGRVVGIQPIPEPNLLTDDPQTLARFRAEEDLSLSTYAVLDKNAGTYRIPIDKAKDLLMKQGLPARPAGTNGSGSK